MENKTLRDCGRDWVSGENNSGLELLNTVHYTVKAFIFYFSCVHVHVHVYVCMRVHVCVFAHSNITRTACGI